MKNFDKLIEKVKNLKAIIAKEYKISESSIVWIGGNKFIANVNGQEIIIIM